MKTVAPFLRQERRKRSRKKEKVFHYESQLDLAPLLEKAVNDTETLVIDEETGQGDEFAELF